MRYFPFTLVLTYCTLVASSLSNYICTEDERSQHPNHCFLMDLAASDPEKMTKALSRWAQDLRIQAPVLFDQDRVVNVQRKLRSSKKTPTVLSHGMGDSCYNSGMQSITNRVESLTHQYATCIPTGDNLHEDTLNGYFKSMLDNVDIFAEQVRSDPQLTNGFNAIGFSQGNNIIRGYIAKYNDPPVKTFISVNGVNGGISAVPFCIPSSSVSSSQLSSRICDALMEMASHRAYSDFSQTHSFQACYWRDPRPSAREQYQKFSQLAHIGNEGIMTNYTYNLNWAKTEKFVWIMANDDKIVWPKEGEQWGSPDPEDPFDDSSILPYRETEWYQKDLFGLRTADVSGKNYFENFDGDHLQFEIEDFDRWVMTYLN